MNPVSAIVRHVLPVGLALALCALCPVAASAQFCLSQGDCEDGLFCTVDTCVLGLCVRTERNCADFNLQCTVDRCNESFNRCDHIVVIDSPCEDFNLATINDRCNAQGECKGDLPPLSCDTSNDCPNGQVCSQGVCRVPTPTLTRVPTLPIAATETPTRTRTRTRTATRTATRTRTRTTTGSPTPTATPTPAASPTPSPTSATQCPGDCDGDGVVSVNELVRGVNIALETLPIDACPQFDTNGNGRVEIGEIVAAVQAVLNGCE